MVKVGIIGIGMMGNCHLDMYAQLPEAQIVAVADRLAERRSGQARTALNVQASTQGTLKFDEVKQYTEGLELIGDPNIELVDICVPTPGHVDLAIAALQAGKHVMVEKPVAISYMEAQRLIAAAKATKKHIMCGLCMRFWPEWRWLKETIDSKRFGRVLGAQFRRTASFPGTWYANAQDSGGAILDLHIHDTDFIQYCFGVPQAVHAVGYALDTKGIDHVVTQYLYKDVSMVVAEGGWSMAKNYGFRMQYCVNFEQATAIYDLGDPEIFKVFTRAGEKLKIEVPTGMGYFHELQYLLNCIKNNTSPAVATIEQAAMSVKIVEAERQSIATGQTVTL